MFEFYGTGNAPGKKGRFLSAIVEAIKSGVIVCAASQCPVGTVSLDKYAVGGKLSAAGVISGYVFSTPLGFSFSLTRNVLQLFG